MSIDPLASQLVERLRQTNKRIVLAESCTGGRVAAELTKVPGVSECFCGSLVTYRDDSKIRWLGVDSETITNLTAVSAPVTHQMALCGLKQTPEANLSVAITGHFGPLAPSRSDTGSSDTETVDGLVFIASAQWVKGKPDVRLIQNQLSVSGRENRQQQAMQWVLQAAIDAC